VSKHVVHEASIDVLVVGPCRPEPVRETGKTVR
jgi:hypothetical protein